jgi:hypothetical protein
MTTGDCYQGQAHLPGVRRRSGELVCCRCGCVLEAASEAKAWGKGDTGNGNLAETNVPRTARSYAITPAE